jgi:hypothetical protein
MFIAVSLVLVVVATLASYPPARRAMRRSHCGFALRIVGTWPGYHEPSPWGVAVTQDQLLVTSSVGRVRFGDCFEYEKTPLPATASLPALHGSLKSHVALCQTRQNLAEEKIGLGSTLHLPSPQFKPTNRKERPPDRAVPCLHLGLFDRLSFSFGCNRNLDVTAFFELHFVAMFVGQ